MNDDNIIEFPGGSEEDDGLSRVRAMMAEVAEYEASKISKEEYRDAVETLIPHALGDTSGSRAAAGVLLSVWNEHEFHLDISDLNVLDIKLYYAAIKVIRGRVEQSSRPDSLGIENCDEIFGRIWDLWENLKIVNRAKARDL